MKQTSVWEPARKPEFSPLTGTVATDVVVIGSGITGLTTAYLLSVADKQVAVLERGALIAESTTAYTTAFLTAVIDTDPSDLVTIYGEAYARDVMQAHQRAIDRLEAIAREEKIDCEFHRVPLYQYARDDKEYRQLAEEEQVAQKLGFAASRHEERQGSIVMHGYLTYADQGLFHPLKYLEGLRSVLEARGVQFYEQSEVEEVTADGSTVRVRTRDGEVVASAAVVATYNRLLPKGSLFFKKGTYTTFVYAGTLPAGQIPHGIYEDLMLPYHYLRVESGTKGYDRFIVGGEDRRSDIPVKEQKHFEALHEYLQSISSGTATITHRWTGPIVEPVDGLAFIGPVRDEPVYYATGFSGNGMTYGTIAGHVIAGRILGEKNEWTTTFGPRFQADRTPTAKALAYKARDYGEELFGGAVKDALR